MLDVKVVMPQSLDDALAFLKDYGKAAKIIAGGTDLLVLMKKEKVTPQYLVDLQSITGMDKIEIKGDYVEFGPMVTHAQVADAGWLPPVFHALREACRRVGSPQIRNTATLAGNIVNASPAADAATALLTLGAEVLVASASGRMWVPLDGFWRGPGQTILGPEEMIVSIRVPKYDDNAGSAFIKMGRRHALAISVVNVAILVLLDPGRKVFRKVNIALGSVAPRIIRATQAEEVLAGRGLGDYEAKQKAINAAQEAASPIDDLRATAEYRRKMVGVLLERALEAAAGRAGRANHEAD